MDAIELLKQDHRVVEELFQKVEDTPPSRHKELFKRIQGELETHAHVEEKIFYPALKKRGDGEAKKIVLEGVEEHHHMKISLAEIGRITPKNERFDAKLKVMIEMVRHHVKEEEGMGGMFSKARTHLDNETLERLGEKMLQEKETFMKANKTKPEKRPAPGFLDTLVGKAKELIPGASANGKSKNVEETRGGSTSRSAPKSKKKDAHRGDPTGSGRSAKPTRSRTADAASKTASKTKAGAR